MGNNQDSSETRSLAVMIIGLTLLGFMIVFVIRKTLEPARDKALLVKSQVTIQAFSAALTQYHKTYGTFPNVPWADMTRILQGESLRGQNPSNIVFLAPSRHDTPQRWAADAWGTPLNFTIQSNTVRVWSSGPNKKDEKGQGDDLLIEIVVD